MPKSKRPWLSWSTVATCSARCSGLLRGRTWTAVPTRIRRVRAAMKAERARGADCTDRCPLKWISPSQISWRPQASAASTSTSVSSNVSASVAPRRLSSRKTPKCMGLHAAELEVEAADLELLVRIRRPFNVLLQPVVLVGLDHGDPWKMLEEDPGDLLVGLPAELLVHREARGVPQLVEPRIAPVVHGSARSEQPPHHAVRIAERRGRIGPPHALEGSLPTLLRAHGVLEHLDLGVDAHVPPHGRAGLGHGLVLGDVGDGGLEIDLLALVARLLQPIARLPRAVGEGRKARVVVVVALGDGPVGHHAAPAPELLHDGLAIDGQGERPPRAQAVPGRP